MAPKKKMHKKKASTPNTDAPKKKSVKKTAGKKGPAKKKAAKKTPAVKKTPAKKNVFGHREGTLTSVMDALLLKGTTIEDAAAAMMGFKGDGADDKGCARQFKTHIKYLQTKKGAKVVLGKKTSKYKATAATAED